MKLIGVCDRAVIHSSAIRRPISLANETDKLLLFDSRNIKLIFLWLKIPLKRSEEKQKLKRVRHYSAKVLKK